jgi:NADPH2:quinone reductase
MKAIRIHKYGGPEVLTCEDIPIPEPKVGEARVKIEAIGLNYIDIYQRTGLYPLQTPFTLGMEGAGVVDAVGDGVTVVKMGNRFANFNPCIGNINFTLRALALVFPGVPFFSSPPSF